MKFGFLILFITIVIASCSSTDFAKITASLPNLENVSDGTYRGFYDLSGTPVNVTLDVIIRENRIIAVNIIQHRASWIGRRAESITETIIQKQSLDIDAISGATASSKAILKAVENALQ